MKTGKFSNFVVFVKNVQQKTSGRKKYNKDKNDCQ